jgi:hypothetical protein
MIDLKTKLKPTTYKLLHDEIAHERLQEVIDSNIEIDAYGMVVPQVKRDSIRHKITRGLVDTRTRLAQVLGEGKHVIYLPGSYDMIHAGHASYILQGVESYLKAHSRLSRADIFVMILADDDELIEAIKPAYLMDKSADHPRPLENESIYEHLTDINPRLMDLASLPVDLVGFIPAPTRIGNLLGDWHFRRWLDKSAAFAGDGSLLHHLGNDAVSNDVRATIEDYESLLKRIKLGEFTEVIKGFQTAKHSKLYNPKTAAWDVGSWQLMVHKFLGSVPGSQGYYTRIISEHDVKYKDIVAKLMKVSRIDHLFVQDDMVLSTTALANAFGWEELYDAKSKAYQ